jgi:hypothetical protein
MGRMDVPLVALATVLLQLVALHLGALHPAEKALTLVLAFGPFVLLGVVIAVRRRQDAAADAGDRAPGTTGRQDPDR